MKALQSSQNGVLYNEKDEPVSVNDAVMDVEYDSNRFSIGLKCKALVPYYGYIKVTLKKQDNSEVTQVLKIRFK